MGLLFVNWDPPLPVLPVDANGLDGWMDGTTREKGSVIKGRSLVFPMITFPSARAGYLHLLKGTYSMVLREGVRV